MSRHFIWIRPTGQATGGTVVEYTPGDVAAIYSDHELALLLLGKPVQRDGVTHLDLIANVMATEAAERDRAAATPLPQRLLRAVAGLS